jgi:hypothetical protein
MTVTLINGGCTAVGAALIVLGVRQFQADRAVSVPLIALGAFLIRIAI